MAYREPSTQIIIYRDVPLDPDYNNTVYWNSETERSAYFLSKLSNAITLPKQMYQRIESNKMRVQVKYENIVAYNYMSIKNADFGVDWTFYCFITGANYVNEETTDITYEIDVMTTFFFNYTLQECWVRREHQSTDVIGDNIQPESLPLGDYLQSDYWNIIGAYEVHKTDEGATLPLSLVLTQPVIDVQCTVDEGFTTAKGGYVCNVYSGLNHIITSSADDVNDLLAGLTDNNKSDSIVNIVEPIHAVYDIYQVAFNGDNNNAVVQTHLTPRPTTINGYSPKNKKLFTYPYCYLELGTTNGAETQRLRYEYFSDDIKANLYSDPNGNPKIMLIPQGYGEGDFKIDSTHMQNDGTKLILPASQTAPPMSGDLSHSVTLTNFPVCSYAIDGYRAWLAQNQWKIVGQLSGTLGTTALAGLGAVGEFSNVGGTGLGMGIISQAASIAGEWMQASTLPPRGGGNLEGRDLSPVFAYAGDFDFYSRSMTITADYARSIDDYFTRFGYATNRIKVPNRNVRPHWTYTETRNCAISGTLPAWAIKKIQSIYDKGITFWNNINNIGDYSLDNSL